MPTPRNVDSHRTRGTWRADRHRPEVEDEGEDSDLIGRAPAHFSEPLAAAWEELRSRAHWLTVTDEPALEVAARALVALREAVSPTPALLTAVVRALGCCGLTLQSRGQATSIPTRPRSEADPLDEFAPRAAPRLKTAADTDVGR
ncbi:MAG: hypothetical protein K8I65_13185 [Thermoanaerobaculia bacterium]|nr:hypothetical protein [Thermoanaerobaculia bacterium]